MAIALRVRVVISIIYAHPYPRHSRACAALLDAIHDLPGAEIRSLYDRYPDFDIDPAAEQAALERASLVVWLHPLYWYTGPALMKLWLEQVLVRGWAFGDEGQALAGKGCLWVTTTGGDEIAFSPEGRHGYRFDAFVPVTEQVARFCGMEWLDPFVLHGAHMISDAALADAAAALRRRVQAWLDGHVEGAISRKAGGP